MQPRPETTVGSASGVANSSMTGRSVMRDKPHVTTVRKLAILGQFVGARAQRRRCFPGGN